MLLFAVSRFTTVRYEAALGGRRSADLAMQVPGEDGSSVLAEIVAVSASAFGPSIRSKSFRTKSVAYLRGSASRTVASIIKSKATG